MRSKGFKRWFSRHFYLQREKAPSSQAVTDAMTVMEDKALFEGEVPLQYLGAWKGSDWISIGVVNERVFALSVDDFDAEGPKRRGDGNQYKPSRPGL